MSNKVALITGITGQDARSNLLKYEPHKIYTLYLHFKHGRAMAYLKFNFVTLKSKLL
jgi:hypothetical protein